MLPLDEYYFLLHAYDKLGRHLYGDEWTGQELMEAPLDAPDVVAQKRAPLETRLAAVNSRNDEIRAAMKRETKDDVMTGLREQENALFAERAELQQALLHMPRVSEDHLRCYSAYERARKTESMLIEALVSDAIKAQAGTGVMIEWPTWSRMPGFRYYIPLSLVVMPRSASGLRRAAVLFRRKDFDAWLQGVPRLAADHSSQPDPETQCLAWFLDLVRSHPNARPAKKAALREEAVRKFEISGRFFDFIWKKHAPPTWTESGAPRTRR